ncbi:hypothetical protein RB653_007457 [Dictyostelium firmibasis]|uniref:Uncharacterized protein n=1 Tax=Dictyostelium firmibasis TaxID=79012 RepID=A0AAN7YP15_9MYCE
MLLTGEKIRLMGQNKYESTPMSNRYTKAKEAFRSSNTTLNSMKEHETKMIEFGISRPKNRILMNSIPNSIKFSPVSNMINDFNHDSTKIHIGENINRNW